jgi:hypothetical protein
VSAPEAVALRNRRWPTNSTDEAHFETGIEERLRPLEHVLERNVFTSDVPDIIQNMT